MEKNSKLLSVIVPVYKAEKYLHRCVDSILAQTWTNLEIILVDDGSPDRCGEICDEYASKDERVRVIHKTNGGVSSARNAGIDASQGEYIAFVDSDDYIASEMYEKLFAALIPDGFSIVTCDCMLHWPDNNAPSEVCTPWCSKEQLIGNVLISGIGGSCWNMIIPRMLVSNLRFPEYLSCGEDLWFVLRLYGKAESVLKVSEPLYYYSQDNSFSITHSISDETGNLAIRGLSEDKQYLQDAGLFSFVESEWSWMVLRYKTTFVMTPKRFRLYRNLLPEANQYVSDCPLISKRIKMMMRLLDNHLDVIAAIIVSLFRIKRCITHI